MPKVTCIYPENPGRRASGCANFAQPEAPSAGMPSTALLEKLLKIEQAVGHADDLELRAMLMEAQSDALRFQAQMLGVLTELARLRDMSERRGQSALSPVNARAEAATDWVAPALRVRTA